MAINVTCPSCNQAYSVPDDKAGKKFRCKGCESVVTIPDAGGLGGEPDPFTSTPSRSSAGGSSSKRRMNDPFDEEGQPPSRKRSRYEDDELEDEADDEGFDDEYSSSGRRSGGRSRGKRRRGGGSAPLAGLGQRFAGAMVDGLAGMVFMGPGFVMMMANDPDNGGDETLFLAGLGLLGLGGLALMVVQIFLMATRSQSIGKFLLKTQVWDYDDRQPAGFVKIFLLRGVVSNMIGAIPCIGGIYQIVNILFIFSEDHRCLHDRIANTYVVDIS
jgi:uncharacterized RDD family membrane protein YckC